MDTHIDYYFFFFGIKILEKPSQKVREKVCLASMTNVAMRQE